MTIDKEKPQATPRERLAAVEDALRELPHQYDIEYVEQESAVYVNYDFDTAITIEMGDPDTPEYDGMYVLIAAHWDRTHAIDNEHFIGTLADADMAAKVAVEFARSRESM